MIQTQTYRSEGQVLFAKLENRPLRLHSLSKNSGIVKVGTELDKIWKMKILSSIDTNFSFINQHLYKDVDILPI